MRDLQSSPGVDAVSFCVCDLSRPDCAVITRREAGIDAFAGDRPRFVGK